MIDQPLRVRAGDHLHAAAFVIAVRQGHPSGDTHMRLQPHIARILMPTDKTRIARFLDEQNRAADQQVRSEDIFDRIQNDGVVGQLVQHFDVEMRIVAVRALHCVGKGSLRCLKPLAEIMRFIFGHDGHGGDKAVAVIGDGAMTAGMAFEALNHAAHANANMLVVLNDNQMSISHNTGGLNTYFSKIWASKTYTGLREGSKKVLSRIPPAWDLAKRVEEHMKGMVAPGTLFEELGFNYIGPIDGHDLDMLTSTIANMRDMEGPQLLHIITQTLNTTIKSPPIFD